MWPPVPSIARKLTTPPLPRRYPPSPPQVCYHVLGIIHGMWPPVPGTMKDYIAVPKPNGYQVGGGEDEDFMINGWRPMTDG